MYTFWFWFGGERIMDLFLDLKFKVSIKYLNRKKGLVVP